MVLNRLVTPQYQLNEIVLLRTIMTLLLIATHSFSMFSENWVYPNGIGHCNLYMWISHFVSHAMLGGYTFISGYLLTYQKKKILQQSYKTFVYKKSQRILLPGIIFSILYVYMFKEHTFSSLISFCYKLGVGHMWYLPMLMWCMIFGYYLLKHDISLKKALIISGSLIFFYFLPLPFGLSSFFYYAIYFILGMVAYRYKGKGNKVVLSKYKLLLRWGEYLIVFTISTILILYLSSFPKNDLLSELAIKETRTYFRVFSGIFGVWMYWHICLYVTSRHNLPFWVHILSRYSFGIYLYQQFILLILLYHTSLPQLVGTIPLPWICLLITTIMSLGLSFLTSKTKVGKYLLG